jgi:hypothetical protein
MIWGHNEWEIEEAFYTNKRGIDPEKAHLFVILRWMYHGDFRPLAAAIWEGGEGGAIDDAILATLAQFIDEDRLKLVPKGRGRRKDPATFARRAVAALSYEASKRPTSDEKFADVADRLGMSKESVRAAITAWRRARDKHVATDAAKGTSGIK